MSTSATITAKYSDDNLQSRIHVAHDMIPEVVINHMKTFFYEIDCDNRKGRLNWEFMASKYFSKVIEDYRVSQILSSHVEKDHCSYHYEIKPLKDLYADERNDIRDCLSIKVICSSGSVLFEGVLSAIKKKDLLSEDNFVFKDMETNEIIDYINNKSNFQYIKPYGFVNTSGYFKEGVERTLDYFNQYTAKERSFIKHNILNSGYEILRIEDWLIVSYLGCVEHLVMVNDFYNGLCSENNDLYILSGPDSSLVVQDNGNVLLASGN